MTSLHSCVPAALATLAGDLHGGSLVLLDAGSAECIASAAGIKLLSGKTVFVQKLKPPLPLVECKPFNDCISSLVSKFSRLLL